VCVCVRVAVALASRRSCCSRVTASPNHDAEIITTVRFPRSPKIGTGDGFCLW